MSHPSGNLPSTADLARAPSGRRCERCPTLLTIYNPGPLCWPCREREQMESLDGPPCAIEAPGELVTERQRVLRSLLPATLEQVRERRPGLWPVTGAGGRKLSRDLVAIGARPDGPPRSAGSVWSVDGTAGMAPGAPPKTRESLQITAGDRAAVPAAPDDEAAEIAKARAEIRQVEELARARRERGPRRRGRLLARMRAREEEP